MVGSSAYSQKEGAHSIKNLGSNILKYNVGITTNTGLPTAELKLGQMGGIGAPTNSGAYYPG